MARPRTPRDTPARLGAPAEPWYAVWLACYRVIRDPTTGALAASFARTRPLRIRPITTTAGRATGQDMTGRDTTGRDIRGPARAADGKLPAGPAT